MFRQLYGLGDAPALQWSKQSLGSSFTFQPGQRYAVLASVATGTSLATITNYVAGKGFQVTYSCEPPSGCTRNTYNIDAWLTSITAAARSGERWVYAEGNFTGSAPWTVAVTSSFPVTLVVTYSIADVFLAVSSTAPAAPVVAPVATPAGSTSSPWATVAVVGGIAVVGAGVAWWTLSRKRRA
jgi:hypothetical protein